MLRHLYKRDHDDDYLSEFRQKVAAQNEDDFEDRRRQLQRSRNGFIGTMAGISLAAVVSWFILTPRFSDSSGTEVPVIRRPVNPAKIQPTDPGGMQIPNQDKSVYDLVEKKAEENTKTESLLPQPETPQMPVIAPEEKSIENLTEEILLEEDIVVEQDLLVAKPLEENIQPVKSSSGQKVNIPQKPSQISTDVKVSNKAETAPQAAPAPTKAATTGVSKADKGQWQVQLIASANKNAVEQAWPAQVKKYAFLSDLPHEVEEVKAEKGMMYRLKAGAFASRNEADDLCTKIKAAGGSCLVKQK